MVSAPTATSDRICNALDQLWLKTLFVEVSLSQLADGARAIEALEGELADFFRSHLQLSSVAPVQVRLQTARIAADKQGTSVRAFFGTQVVANKLESQLLPKPTFKLTLDGGNAVRRGCGRSPVVARVVSLSSVALAHSAVRCFRRG